jgi:hypothetical protein
MACFVSFVCDVVAVTLLSLLALPVTNTMNVKIMICDVTQCSLVDRPTFGRNLLFHLGGVAKFERKHQVPTYTECIFNCVGCMR